MNGEVAKLNRTSTRLSQLFSLAWEAGHMSTVRKEQASNGAQWPNRGEARREPKGGAGKGSRHCTQGSPTQTHICFSMKGEFLFKLPPFSFPELTVKSKGKFPGKWQNFSIDLPWLEFRRDITDFLQSQVS